MSHGTSRSTEPVTSDGAPPLTYRLIAPAPNPETQVGPLANRARSVPSAPPSYLLNHSFSADTSQPAGHPQSAGPHFTFNLPISWSPSPTISTVFLATLNPSPIVPELPLSHKRSRQERSDSADYDLATEHHRWDSSAGERETAERLTTLYVDPEDYPAYKELQRRVHLSHNEEDRWKACTAFYNSYTSLKSPIAKLDHEIQAQRRKLEEKEATRDDKESNLDALILLGTSFMLSNCERFGHVRRYYDDIRHKRHRSSKDHDPRTPSEDWDGFLHHHSKAARELQQREKALECIAAIWGGDKIRYYGWATKPLAVCQLLKATAMVIPTWEEAGIKLNRLRNHRDRRPRNPIACGKGSISYTDLRRLGEWKGHGRFEMPSTKIRRREGKETIPYAVLGQGEFNSERLGFDKFGILVVKTTAGSDEPVIAFPAPPWGIGQSPAIVEVVEEQTRSPESLPSDQDGDSTSKSQDEAPGAASIRGSARLAARQQTCYASQLVATEHSRSQRARKVTGTRKDAASGGSEGDLGPAKEKDPAQLSNRPMVDAATETDQGLFDNFILAKAGALANASKAHVVPNETSETDSLQQDEGQATDGVYGQQRLFVRHGMESQQIEKNNAEDAGRPTTGHPVCVVGEAAELVAPLEQNAPVTGTEKFCVDLAYNQEFKRLTLDELDETGHEECWGAENSRSCRHYLSISHSPTVGLSNDPVDALFSTLGEAKRLVHRTTPKAPIFTRCNNAGNWKAGLRPTVDYLTRAEKAPTTKVYIQKYSLDSNENSYETVTLWELFIHFVRNDHGADGLELWNALQLENHLKQRHVPEFLRNNNCNLLAEIRQRVDKGEVKNGRKRKKMERLIGKDPLHFALVADGGMNTYPHSDSHGYSTFLTVQEGELIIGWLSRPDDETWDRWAEDPRFFGGGKWCYLVMGAGDSVYFPSGTPHYVIRRKGAQTFILGGHVLQWSSLDTWASLLRKQMNNPATTNEHMSLETTRRYVAAARGLIVDAVERRDDRLEYLGGDEGAGQALRNLEDLRRVIEMKEESEKGKQV